MRVVVAAFGTGVHPMAARALEELAPHAEIFGGPGDDDHAYTRAFADWWHDGEAFIVVEWDIELTPEALHDHEHCMCDWGTSTYYMKPDLYGRALGCTRFSKKLLTTYPDIFDEQVEKVKAGNGRTDWQFLDGIVCDAIVQRAGVFWHDHAAVGHHHFFPEWGARGRCTCGSTNKMICPTRRHHFGDAGCETWHHISPGVAAAHPEYRCLLDAALAEGEEGQRRAREAADAQRMRRMNELDALAGRDPIAAGRERERDRAERESLRRHQWDPRAIEHRRLFGC